MRPAKGSILRRFRIFPSPRENDFVLILKTFEANPALPLLLVPLRPCTSVALLSCRERLEVHVKTQVFVEIDCFAQPWFVCNELLDPPLFLESFSIGLTFTPHTCAALGLSLWFSLRDVSRFRLQRAPQEVKNALTG